MKKLLLSCMLFVAFPSLILAQDIIELGNSESMCITGKGKGQDAVINPFPNAVSFAVVENVGSNTFSIRVEENSTIVKEITIKRNETKKVTVLESYQLYFDSKKPTKAKVSFEKAKAY